ncbi:hypothetical protein [Teredinibacter turnerae]|uniref:hypothetical protein n=1 Tax=Teredinibacter turnerae TaxID=2426 RepID=UPI00036B1FDD|nr:hypothetical protein [Teredinibacter turnerae]
MSVDQLYMAAEILECSITDIVEQAENLKLQLVGVDVGVVANTRGNSTSGKRGVGAGAFLAGAALGALIMAATPKKP